MALKEQIDNDVKAALLERRRFVVDTLRGLKAAILSEEVATGARENGLDDTAIETVIAREVKKRLESKALYEQNDRQDLADTEQQEIDVLQVYLPQQLTDDELRAEVDAAIAETGATNMKAMGQVIGAVKARVGTSADGARVAAMVKQQLTT